MGLRNPVSRAVALGLRPLRMPRAQLQVIFCTRGTTYRAPLQKMTYQDEAFYGSSPPCIYFFSFRCVSFKEEIYLCHEWMPMGLPWCWNIFRSFFSCQPSRVVMRLLFWAVTHWLFELRLVRDRLHMNCSCVTDAYELLIRWRRRPFVT